MSNKSLKNGAAWSALAEHAKAMKGAHLRALFAADAKRFENFHVAAEGLLFDYSKHPVTAETLKLLAALADERGLEHQKAALFAGEDVNTTEHRPALHMALRGTTSETITIDGENVRGFVAQSLAQIETISAALRSGAITDVVHIGIGGSDVGPRLVCEALAHAADGPRLHFAANVDGAVIARILKDLKAATTAFIVASKTFSTQETLMNAHTALDWAGSAENFYAVTANTQKARDFGIAPEHILPMRGWIGGRYSLWSAVGLPVGAALGFETFKELLAGAHAADIHFRDQPPAGNIPVLMAFLSLWHRNFLGRGAQAVLPYADALRSLPVYVQQLEMESNGKSADRDGHFTDYETAPVIFGGTGTESQHAFFQMLHQGSDIAPCDFIAAIAPPAGGAPGHHAALLANMLAQAQALMQGETSSDPHRHFPGNRPSSVFLLETLEARNLGFLLACYEHKIFVQGALWNLNSFDQWGVELGKKLATPLLEALENNQKIQTADSSTRGLLAFILRKNQ